MDSSVLDLTFLTETEKNLILEVLNRDEAIQKKEDERITWVLLVVGDKSNV